MKKKVIAAAVFCVLIIIVIAAVLTKYVDSAKVTTNHEPPGDDVNSADLNTFYNRTLTAGNDIRNLGSGYGIFDAQKDGCLVVGIGDGDNTLYKEFMNAYKDQKDAFIRVAQSTVEGDVILYDVMYRADLEEFWLVTDNTRDEFAADEDRKIQLKVYEDTAEYKYQERLYWILFDRILLDETIENGDAFIVMPLERLSEYDV